jgi:hypothetical protein
MGCGGNFVHERLVLPAAGSEGQGLNVVLSENI